MVESLRVVSNVEVFAMQDGLTQPVTHIYQRGSSGIT